MALIPNTGPVAGGNVVLLVGFKLTNVNNVRFGTAAATSFIVNDNLITTIAAANAASAVLVTVSTGTATSKSLIYTY